MEICKNPSVRPVGIGDVVHLLFTESVFELSCKEATYECRKNQLYGGMSSGIEGETQ